MAKRMTLAISSAVSRRPIDTKFDTNAAASSGAFDIAFWSIGLSVNPGHTHAVCTPDPNKSCVLLRMRPTVACLAVTYESRPATAFSESVEPTKMIEDPVLMCRACAPLRIDGATTETLIASAMCAGSLAVTLSCAP
jgi:hypothetical protein